MTTWNAGCASPGFCGTATDNSGAGSAEGRADDPPGHGELLGRKRLLERHARVRARDRYRTWSYAFPATSFSADGAYTVQARAVDNLNGVETPSSRTFTVDRTPPNAFSLTSPAAGFVGSGASSRQPPSIPAWSGIAQLAFRYCAGGSCAFGAGTAIGSPIATTGSASQSWDLSSLTNGAQYTAIARATDVAGNTTDSAPTTVTLDTSPPTTTDDAPAGSKSSDVTVTLSPSDGSGSGVGSTNYRLDGGAWRDRYECLDPGAGQPRQRRRAHDRLLLDRQRRQCRGRQAGDRDDRHAAAEWLPRSIRARSCEGRLPSPTRRRPTRAVALGPSRSSTRSTGANSWTAIGTRTSAPWAVLFDTTAVPDGQYDLREVISDAAVPPNVTDDRPPRPSIDRQHAAQ